MEEGVIANGTILSVNSDSGEKQWAIGSLIGVNGIEKTYEVALYNNETPTNYPAIIKIVPRGVEPLPKDFKFYLDNVNPTNISRWKNARGIKNVSLPVLLGAGETKLDETIYLVVIIKRHEKDVWSLFLKNGRKMNEPTVYKIGTRLLSTLQYMHCRSWVYGDIKGSNIMVDSSENHIYLVNYHFASQFTTSNKQVNSNEPQNVAVEYMSRDAHTGVLTMRGDIESLFYNLLQWLGVKLPWEKNLENLSLVLQQKNNAFANVEEFLSECFEKTKIPGPIRNFMNEAATMKREDNPRYSAFKWILRNGLTSLCHVPAGKLIFPVYSVNNDEQNAEIFNKGKKNKSRRGPRSELGASVDQLAKIITNNCKDENEVDLRTEDRTGSLINAIYQITRMKRSPVRQRRLADAWEQDLQGLKTTTKRLWALKANRRATSNTVSTEKQQARSSQDSPISTQVNNGLNHSNPGSSVSQSYFGATNSPVTSPQEELALLELLQSSSSNGNRSASTSLSSAIQNRASRADSSSYNLRRRIQDDSRSEDISTFRTPEQMPAKKPCRLPMVVIPKTKHAADSSDEQVTQCWRSESVVCESWQDKYEMLSTWLKMKEQNFGTFGSIPSEPQMVVNQVQQVRVLLDDFRTREPRLHQLTNALARLPRDSADALKLEEIEGRWWKLLTRLKKRGQQLGGACLEGLRDALQDVSRKLEQLPLDEEPGDQLLREIESSAKQLEDLHRTLLSNAATIVEPLCQALDDAAINSDLRTQLRSVKKFYDDLQHRINDEKAKIESSLNHGQQLEDSRPTIIDWLSKEFIDMSEKSVISANPKILKRQLEHYKLVVDKEAEVIGLFKRGREALSLSQNLENVPLQQGLLDLTESQWDRLKKHSLQMSNKLQMCIEHHDNYCQAQKLLEPWLSEIEQKLRSLQPATLDDVKVALTELFSLRVKVHDKSKEFEQCANLGDTFVSACDGDKDVVKNELIAMKDRREKINNDLRERTQFLKDTTDSFDVFNKCLNDLEQSVDDLKSRHALLEEKGDSNLIDCIKKLQEEADSLRGPPLEDVRQLADELASKVGDQGIDTSHLLNVVKCVAADIESFWTKLAVSLNKAYEQKLASVENDIKPTIDNVQEQDVKPRILLYATNQLSDEIVDLVTDSESEADLVIDEKPLLSEIDPMPEELINLVSSSESEDDLVTQQQIRLEPHVRTHHSQLEEVLENGESSSTDDKLELK